jgi:hypothetical protein
MVGVSSILVVHDATVFFPGLDLAKQQVGSLVLGEGHWAHVSLLVTR